MMLEHDIRTLRERNVISLMSQRRKRGYTAAQRDATEGNDVIIVARILSKAHASTGFYAVKCSSESRLRLHSRATQLDQPDNIFDALDRPGRYPKMDHTTR